MRDEAGTVTAVSCVARDIRHQKLQEHLIAESHQRLKLSLESAGSSLWDWDILASRVHYDEAFCRMLAYKPAELPEAGRPWEGLLHPDDVATVDQRLEDHLEGHTAMCELEFRVRARHGDWIWIGARGRVVTRDWAGSPVRMMGTCQEISERKRAEHVEQMLSAFLDSSDDAIVSRTLEGTILSWNRGAERILGFSADEMVGRTQRAFVPADRIDEEMRISELARSGQTHSNIEALRLHKNGREVHLSLTCAPLRDAAGRVVGVAWIGRDITERIRADAARSLLAAVVESSQDAIISHDMNSTILSWNRGAEEIFGYAAREAVGHDYRLLVTGDALQQVRERRLRIQQGEKIPPFETNARRKDGTSVAVSISADALRNEAGKERSGQRGILDRRSRHRQPLGKKVPVDGVEKRLARRRRFA
jgi:PAS domain S-box-containing protein